MIVISIIFMTPFIALFSSILLEITCLRLALKLSFRLLSIMLSSFVVGIIFSFDIIGLMLVLLTAFIIFLLVRGSYSRVNFGNKSLFLFLLVNMLILFFLVLAFFSSKVVNFYLFFEASLIPIFLLVLG